MTPCQFCFYFQRGYDKDSSCKVSWNSSRPGGSLRYLGGCIRSLSKFKNTPKALISGQKKHPYFQKTLTFPLKKHPFFYQNTDIGWTVTRNLTLDVIILCLFSGSRLGSSDINIDTNNIRCISKVQYCRTTDSDAQSLRESLGVRGDFQPLFFVPGFRKYPSFTKLRTWGGLKKDPYLLEIRNAGCAPPLYPRVPPPGFPWGIFQMNLNGAYVLDATVTLSRLWGIKGIIYTLKI